MIKAVIVDVDDTLCLTEATSFDLENEVLAEMGRPPMSRELHLANWGEPLLEAMPRRSPGLDLERFLPLFHSTMRRHIAEGRLDVIPPENLEALDRLVLSGRTVMLLTSRAEVELRHMLEPDHVLAGRISGAWHRDNTRHGKPDPGPSTSCSRTPGCRRRSVSTSATRPVTRSRRAAPGSLSSPACRAVSAASTSSIPVT